MVHVFEANIRLIVQEDAPTLRRLDTLFRYLFHGATSSLEINVR